MYLVICTSLLNQTAILSNVFCPLLDSQLYMTWVSMEYSLVLYHQCGMSFNYCVVYVVSYSMAYCMCWMYNVTLFPTCNYVFLTFYHYCRVLFTSRLIAAPHVFKCLKTFIISISGCVLLPCVACMVFFLHYSSYILLFPVALKDLAHIRAHLFCAVDVFLLSSGCEFQPSRHWFQNKCVHI